MADQSSTSNVGGRTSKGSGTPYAFGGSSYEGGAQVPFKAGSRSPGGLKPSLLGLAAVSSLLPGVWLLAVYQYFASDRHTFHRNNARNETLPVLCVCSEHSECGCDTSSNETYYNAVYDTARRTPSDADSFTATIANVNGTRTLVINGTLANGTTAPGGSDDDTSSASGRTSGAQHWVALSATAVAIVALLSL